MISLITDFKTLPIYIGEACQKFLNGPKRSQYHITSRNLFKMRFSTLSWTMTHQTYCLLYKLLFSNCSCPTAQNLESFLLTVFCEFSSLLFTVTDAQLEFSFYGFFFSIPVSIKVVLEKMTTQTLSYSCGQQSGTYSSLTSPSHQNRGEKM